MGNGQINGKGGVRFGFGFRFWNRAWCFTWNGDRLVVCSDCVREAVMFHVEQARSMPC